MVYCWHICRQFTKSIVINLIFFLLCVYVQLFTYLFLSYPVSPEEGVSVFPLNMTFNRGDSVTFNCSAQGGPGNTYQWQWNGTDLGNETAQALTVTQITVNSGGEYTCVVSNAAGSGSASTWLNVSPEMVLNPTDVFARNGTVHMLSCKATAFPEPQYVWVHVRGTSSGSVAGANSSMLVFDLVMFGDEGSYYCRATSYEVTVVSDIASLTGLLCVCLPSLCLILHAWSNSGIPLQFLQKVVWLCYLKWLWLSLELLWWCCAQYKAAQVSPTSGRDMD